jgi:hypothetical protein
MLCSTQAMTNTWTYLPSRTKGMRIVKVEEGGKIICAKAGLFQGK